MWWMSSSASWSLSEDCDVATTANIAVSSIDLSKIADWYIVFCESFHTETFSRIAFLWMGHSDRESCLCRLSNSDSVSRSAKEDQVVVIPALLAFPHSCQKFFRNPNLLIFHQPIAPWLSPLTPCPPIAPFPSENSNTERVSKFPP